MILAPGVPEWTHDVAASGVRQAGVALLAVEQRLAAQPQVLVGVQPEPLSPKIGFGMNVAVLPLRQATFLTMYLNFMTSSAAFSSSSKR